MNYFDVLVLAFVGLALVAVYQMRPCTLILAGNNMLVSRALSAIDRGGTPASQGFLPSYVFSEENLSIAATILTISLVTLVGFTILTVRRRIRIGPGAPAVPQPLLIAIGLYLVAYAGGKSTIFSGGYGVANYTYYDIELAGGHTFICAILLYELLRRRLLAKITARKALFIMFAIFATIGYAKGGTGLTTGYLVTSAVLLLPRTGAANRMTNMVRIAAVMGAIVHLSFIVRGVRASLATEGTSAVSGFFDSLREMEDQRDDLGDRKSTRLNSSH